MFLVTDALVIGLRAITFVALFQAAGAAAFLALYERYVDPSSAERIRAVARVAALVALCAAVFHYVLTPARMAGDFGGTFDASLESLLLRSNSGTAHIVRVVGLGVLLLSLDRASRLNTWASLAGAGLAVSSFALMGHTTIHEWRFALVWLLLAHVAVGAWWFGSLAGLYVVVRGEPRERSGALIARFSRHAQWTVPAIFVCGALIGVVFIRSWAELATAYGAMVLGKTAAFALLMGLAAQNRRRFGPGLLAGDPRAALGLRRVILAEWAVLAVVLMATATMTALFSPEHLDRAFAPEHQVEPTH